MAGNNPNGERDRYLPTIAKDYERFTSHDEHIYTYADICTKCGHTGPRSRESKLGIGVWGWKALSLRYLSEFLSITKLQSLIIQASLT